MRLVLLGLPGAGKGTQADLLSERYGVPHISTGQIFRQAIAEGTEAGRQANSYISRGELVPDDITLEIVELRLSKPDCRNGFILDGFPRTVPQAAALDEILSSLGAGLSGAIDIQISEAEAIRRIAGRRVCSGCGATFRPEQLQGLGKTCPECGGSLEQRSDDNEATVRNRLNSYVRQTVPVIRYYMNNGLLYRVDGENPVEEVFNALCALLDEGLGFSKVSGEVSG